MNGDDLAINFYQEHIHYVCPLLLVEIRGGTFRRMYLLPSTRVILDSGGALISGAIEVRGCVESISSYAYLPPKVRRNASSAAV